MPYQTAKAVAPWPRHFLEAFIPEGVEWIHLDIAGPAETNGSACAAKGATGVMIETLNRLLCS